MCSVPVAHLFPQHIVFRRGLGGQKYGFFGTNFATVSVGDLVRYMHDVAVPPRLPMAIAHGAKDPSPNSNLGRLNRMFDLFSYNIIPVPSRNLP